LSTFDSFYITYDWRNVVTLFIETLSFRTPDCKTFMTTMQEVAESQGEEEEENKDASDTAAILEKLTVGEDKPVGKEPEKVTKTEKLTVGENKTEEKKTEEVTNTHKKDEHGVV